MTAVAASTRPTVPYRAARDSQAVASASSSVVSFEDHDLVP